MKNKNLSLATMLLLSQTLPAAELPSAGSELRQIVPPPAALVPRRPLPDLPPEPARAQETAAPDGAKTTVQSLQLTGMREFTAQQLTMIAGFVPGAELSLSQLREMAARIADHYHANGFFLAQAYLPPQEVRDGVVTIAIIEGTYGKLDLRLSTNLSERLANRMLANLRSGDTIASRPLESSLLTLSDIPGINVRSTLVPGAAVGTSDLLVEIMPGPRVTGTIDADNQGNRYTGMNHLGATVNVNNPAGQGDQLNLRALYAGSGLDYGRLAYQMQLGAVRAGLAYSHLHYALGDSFASLGATGTAATTSFFGSMPMIRRRDVNLNAQLSIDAKSFRDKVGSTDTSTDKKARALTASLNGDRRDGFGGGGVTGYSLAWTHGSLDIRSAAARDADATTARTEGSYDKFALNLMRSQAVTELTSLYAALNAQAARKNLDISEKIQLGGAGGVRAYPEGEAHGDQGYVLNLEVRRVLPDLFGRLPGQIQVAGFVDTGTVLANKTPWTPGNNRRTLSGAGVGMTWADEGNFLVKASIAHKIGVEKATSAPDSATRAWVQAVKYF